MDTLGDLVKEWRRQSGLSRPELARLVREASEHDSPGSRVQRQHIDQLEAAGSRTPRYIGELAKAMRASVDDLMALRMPPPLQAAGAAPPQTAESRDRHAVSDSDWALLQDVKMLDEGTLREVRDKARLIRETVDRLLAERLRPSAVIPITSVPPAPPSMGDRRKAAPFVLQQPGEPYDPLRMGDRRKSAPFVLGDGAAPPAKKQPATKKGGR